MQLSLRKFSKGGIFFLFMILWFVEPLNRALGNLSFSIANILGISATAIAEGFSLFRGSSGMLLIAVLGVGLLVRRLRQKPYEVWYDKGKLKRI
ncbi:MAG: hypothetical protein HC820_01320 [Hydrococcus sp. RM1_1_31]|nr:hypothetical protein [Hydrococcus sp. RM1_1_31]